jgi:hypothetical protein
MLLVRVQVGLIWWVASAKLYGMTRLQPPALQHVIAQQDLLCTISIECCMLHLATCSAAASSAFKAMHGDMRLEVAKLSMQAAPTRLARHNIKQIGCAAGYSYCGVEFRLFLVRVRDSCTQEAPGAPSHLPVLSMPHAADYGGLLLLLVLCSLLTRV